MHAWRDILRLSAEYLVQKGVPDAQVAAELLVARLLKCGRGFLSPHLDETPDPKYVEAMRRGIWIERDDYYGKKGKRSV